MMTLMEKTHKAIKEAKNGNYVITDIDTGKTYKYGENPYADMMIENAVFVDLFPECVENTFNFYGFNRNRYVLEHYDSFGNGETL